MKNDDNLREMFDRFDDDKNGSIDFAEFKDLLAALDYVMDSDSQRLAFTSIDENSSSMIQFDEFKNWWQENN